MGTDVRHPKLGKILNGIKARPVYMQPLGLRPVTLTERPSKGGVYSEANTDPKQLDRLREFEIRAQTDTALR